MSSSSSPLNNTADCALRLVWVDYGGQEVFYQNVPAHSVIGQWSWVGNAWRLRRQDNNQLVMEIPRVDGDMTVDVTACVGDTLATLPITIGETTPPNAVAATSTPLLRVGGTANLDGSGSQDTDSIGALPDIAKYSWTLTNTTDLRQAPIPVAGKAAVQPVQLPIAGEYAAELVVTDNEGEVSTLGSSDAHVTIKVVQVTFDPVSVTVAPDTTAKTKATVVPPSAVGDVTFGLDDTAIATVDQKKLTASPGDLTVTGVKEGTTTLRAEITTDLGSVTVGSADVTVKAKIKFVSALGAGQESETWPVRYFISRGDGISLYVIAKGVADSDDVTYTLKSARFPPQEQVVTGGTLARFSLSYPLAGDYTNPDHLELIAQVGQNASQTIFTTDAYPVRVVLMPNPDITINQGRDRVDLTVNPPLKEPGEKVIAATSPWHDDLKTILRFAIVGPNVGPPGQPIVVLDSYSPSGPTTLVSPHASKESKTGITNLVAFIKPTFGSSDRICSNTLPLYVWERGSVNAWVEGRPFSKAVIPLLSKITSFKPKT